MNNPIVAPNERDLPLMSVSGLAPIIINRMAGMRNDHHGSIKSKAA